jgi:mono/diheme cytochrome c family protein
MLRGMKILVIPCLALFFECSAAPQSGSDAQVASSQTAKLALSLRTARTSPYDLELGGELAGLPAGETRYLTHDDLLSLPQVTFSAGGDEHFANGTKLTGVRVEELVKRVAAAPDRDMAVAICSDKYRANYPGAYVAAHHPVLVLMIDGKPPADWPKDAEYHKFDMGPYVVSHENFALSFKILSYNEQPQIPWGIVRIEFRNEQAVLNSIAPRGPHAKDAAVAAGYRIAREECFLCHNSGREGGTKAGVPWAALAALASSDPKMFKAYVRNPQSQNPGANMPPESNYDTATLDAVAAYFQSAGAPAGR